ncbi:lipid A deacylase LpxR family protein [Azospirillum thermophilum]|uniref:DUF2219 domain-containing protein n=1 Tax=Azospirillum thermophilum TaxID=2202148 RepID=A0A2S2CPE2_9PROT|nr:lipid A deacylase LpxR family protein [Azospirillum thermophilum]AWK86393.1 DUF2219 domain-containing protein [Azospirillum thermophilum]
MRGIAGGRVAVALAAGLSAGLGAGAGGAQDPAGRDAGPAAAPDGAERAGPSIGFWIDNDLFGGNTDRYYTNGFQFYYFSGDRPTYGSIDWLADLVPWIEPDGVRRYGFAFGQNIYTPSNLRARNPDPTDRPYAGWLYGRLSILNEAPRAVDRIDLDLGMVGPASLAEQTQKAVHKVVRGATYPEGWRYQLRDEPGVVLGYEHVWRGERPNTLGPLEWDLSPHVAGSVGNVLTMGAAGATLRLGGNMPAPVGALVMRPTSSIPYQDSDGRQSGTRGFSWYVYTSAEGRAVGRNIFLDGNSDKPGRSVEKRTLVGAVQAGVALRYGRYGLTYAQTIQTPEFEGQKSLTNYGSLRLSVQF